jgi:predicted DNA-binding protein (UPF0251 family)
MPRPQAPRKIGVDPEITWFKPAGVRMIDLQEVVLTLDELEALRLADLEGLYQEQAAERMGISRPTLGRILTTAHKKVAEALIRGKAIRLEGGAIEKLPSVPMRCPGCQHEWRLPGGTPAHGPCPACGERKVERGDTGLASGCGG